MVRMWMGSEWIFCKVYIKEYYVSKRSFYIKRRCREGKEEVGVSLIY